MRASNSQKGAYATILHSGGDYVCGAIAIAQSIRRTGSTRDLVALVDSSISPEHRKGLEEAGWKVRDYVKITSSSSLGKQKDFSTFRLWQLDYDKVNYLPLCFTCAFASVLELCQLLYAAVCVL